MSTIPFNEFCIKGNDSTNGVNCSYCILLSICYIGMIIILIIQTKRRLKLGSKRKSKKCIIFYLMMGDFFILLVNQLLYDDKYIVEIEPFYRISVFIFVFYYISVKLSKLSSQTQRTRKRFKAIAIIMISIVIIALILVIVELALDQSELFSICQFKYDKISRIVGALVTTILIIVSFQLQNKMDSKIEPHYQDHHPLLQIKNFQINETQREDLRILIIIYFASQFLTIFQMLYYLIKSINYVPEFSNCTQCQLMPCVRMAEITTISLELLLRFLFTIIIILLPYIAIMQFFWLSSKKIPQKFSSSKEEADTLDNLFHFTQLNNSLSKITKSDRHENTEKSSPRSPHSNYQFD